jgi:hypothetical protein
MANDAGPRGNWNAKGDSWRLHLHGQNRKMNRFAAATFHLGGRG